jgi:hypothetical protein
MCKRHRSEPPGKFRPVRPYATAVVLGITCTNTEARTGGSTISPYRKPLTMHERFVRGRRVACGLVVAVVADCGLLLKCSARQCSLRGKTFGVSEFRFAPIRSLHSARAVCFLKSNRVDVGIPIERMII